MKRLVGIMALVALWPVAGLHAQAAKKPLTVDLIVHGEKLAAPGISRLEWRPGH